MPYKCVCACVLYVCEHVGVRGHSAHMWRSEQREAIFLLFPTLLTCYRVSHSARSSRFWLG